MGGVHPGWPQLLWDLMALGVMFSKSGSRPVRVRVLSVQFRFSSGSNVERIGSKQFSIEIVDRARSMSFMYLSRSPFGHCLPLFQPQPPPDVATFLIVCINKL